MSNADIAAELTRCLKGTPYVTYRVRYDSDCGGRVSVSRTTKGRRGDVLDTSSVTITGAADYAGVEAVRAELEAQGARAARATTAAIRAERARS